MVVIQDDFGDGDENLLRPVILEKSFTMMEDSLADKIGLGLDPIAPCDDDLDGYDSDPEVNFSGRTRHGLVSLERSSSPSGVATVVTTRR